MSTVIPLQAPGTNLTYLHRCGADGVFVVDPNDAATVLRALQQHDLSLAAILATHHHWDHVAGVADLQAQTGCRFIGVDRALVPAPDRIAAHGSVLTIGDATIHVIATPGHTRNSVCYYVPAQGDESPVVYTGDTLFVGGCGRLLEGDAAVMWQSLQKLAALPDATLVCCGHDYTLENYEFAATIDPGNRRFQERLTEVCKALEYGRLTVPSTIAQERTTNVFLLADTPSLKDALGMAAAPPEEVFAELRRRKDLFG
ncbi:MAG: hydroxyacylglutathione hydrolase [Planctomycetes bacterium]|nr:hydroxyacylglutathione hydrolase [Planctomycetota bacterium]